MVFLLPAALCWNHRHAPPLTLNSGSLENLPANGKASADEEGEKGHGLVRKSQSSRASMNQLSTHHLRHVVGEGQRDELQ